jgi:hypothetical protein
MAVNISVTLTPHNTCNRPACKGRADAFEVGYVALAVFPDEGDPSDGGMIPSAWRRKRNVAVQVALETHRPKTAQ